MRNTIKKVTIVVPVFMTSCQVSEKLKSGPVIDQIKTTATASKKTVAVPAKLETRVAARRNASFMVMLIVAHLSVLHQAFCKTMQSVVGIYLRGTKKKFDP